MEEDGALLEEAFRNAKRANEIREVFLKELDTSVGSFIEMPEDETVYTIELWFTREKFNAALPVLRGFIKKCFMVPKLVLMLQIEDKKDVLSSMRMKSGEWSRYYPPLAREETDECRILKDIATSVQKK